MRILLSNDDGIEAPGLGALRAAVQDLGHVTVVAPDTPQSAAGHGITVHQPLIVKRLNSPDGGELLGISVDGRPADCVRLAIRMLLEKPPELVLAGINHGANAGINVFYSGTVAAAAEAAMLGIPAIAFSASADSEGKFDFPRAAATCRWVLDQLLRAGLSPGDLFNVNLPAGPPKGLSFVPQSTAGLEDTYRGRPRGDGAEEYSLGSEYSFRHQADSDVSALAEGFITVTPLHFDMTNHDRLAALKELTWPKPPE
jgi:5'-nucleotidase